jgi:hypothetical protein
LDHSRERFLGRSARLEKRRKVRAAAQLRNAEINGSDTGLPETIAVTVAAVAPLGRSLTVLGAGVLLDLKLHEPLGNVAEQFTDNFVLCPLFNELGECDTGFGHRGSLS